MSRWLTLLILLVAALKSNGQQDQQQALQSLLAEAAQAQAANQFHAAAEAYRQAAGLRPDLPEIWANLGLMLHESGEYAAAIESFRKANGMNPSLYVPNLFLGIDLFQTGRSKEALPWLLRAQAMNRPDAEPELFLGRVYAALGKPSQAVAAMEYAVQLDPKRSQLWFYLGMMRLDEVEDEARTMASEGRDSPWTRTLYAESLLRQARYNEAVEVLNSLLAETQAPCVRADLGLAYLKTHDPDHAREQLQPAVAISSSCSLLGQVRLGIETQQDDQAVQLLRTVWDRDEGFVRSAAPLFMEGLAPENAERFTGRLLQASQSGEISGELAASAIAAITDTPQPPASSAQRSTGAAPSPSAEQAYAAGRYRECAERAAAGAQTKSAAQLRLLAACSYFTGDDAGASRAAELLLSAAPHSTEALYWSVKANERLADQELQHYEELEPNSEQTHLLLGDSYRQRRLFDDARAEYRKALALHPNDPAALLGLASACFGVGDTGGAIQAAQAALDQKPSDPELNLLMGEALVERHDFAQAEPYLNRSLTAKPQMLPRVHALLGRVYQETGRTTEALHELQLGLSSDTDGTVHYQLARVYRQLGDEKDATAALAQMKELQQHRRQTAVLAMEDSRASQMNGGPQ